jgi:predicted O-methyltransferase YrrM
LNLLSRIGIALSSPGLTTKYLLSRSELSRNIMLCAYLTRCDAEWSRYLKEAAQVVEEVRNRFQTRVINTEGYPAWPMSNFGLLFLYSLTRIQRPQVVLETGVGHGASSAVLTQAMRANGSGKLYSIDLPNAKYPMSSGIISDSMGAMETGWLVSDSLKSYWTLVLGESRQKLPELLEQVASVDFFIHDSEHTYQAMMFEYTSVWPHLSRGGFLISDDVNWNEAFGDFCSANHAQGRIVARWGATRKPR